MHHLIIGLLTFSLSFGLCAQQLNSATVDVGDRSNIERQNATKAALLKVLAKNSGPLPSPLPEPVQASLNNANALLVQFNYQQRPDLSLTAHFDYKKVLTILRSAALPIWGKQRPTTLFWLYDATSDEMNLVSASSAASTTTSSEVMNERYALPIQFPLMDLQDLLVISTDDVKGFFINSIAKASARYASDYFYVINVSRVDAGFRADVELFSNKGGQDEIHRSLLSKQIVQPSKEALFLEVQDALMEYYTPQYAFIGSDEEGKVTLEFSGVEKLADLLDIEKYLLSLLQVKGLTIKEVNTQIARFELELQGNVNELKRILSLNPKVVSASEPTGLELELNDDGLQSQPLDNVIRFSWSPNT